VYPERPLDADLSGEFGYDCSCGNTIYFKFSKDYTFAMSVRPKGFGSRLFVLLQNDASGTWHTRLFDPLPCAVLLMPSAKDVSAIPTEGTKPYKPWLLFEHMIIIASIDNVLHFRTFAGDGKVVVDTDETRLTEHAREIEDLRKRLSKLWPPPPMEGRLIARRKAKMPIIAAVTSIVGHTHPTGQDINMVAGKGTDRLINAGFMSPHPWDLMVLDVKKFASGLLQAAGELPFAFKVAEAIWGNQCGLKCLINKKDVNTFDVVFGPKHNGEIRRL
jgi:hypothetical protein